VGCEAWSGGFQKSWRNSAGSFGDVLFVDEFQNFATEAFCSILAEARKYRLTLILSHQYIAQLSPSVRHAVFGNVGSLITFKVGFDDAEHLHGEYGRECEPPQLVDPACHASLVRLPQGTTGGRYNRARSLPPLTTFRGRRHRLIVSVRGSAVWEQA